MSEKTGRTNVVVAIAILVAFSAFGIALHVSNAEYRDSGSWPTVEGEVVESKIEREERRRSHTVTVFVPKVSYKYMVDSIDYVSSKLAVAGTTFCNSAKAHNYIKQFSKGKKCPVYYDPENPQIAVLVPASENVWPPYLLIAFAFVFAILFVLKNGTGK